MTRPAVRDLVGTADIWIVTLDTLRHDVAVAEFDAGRTPHLAALIGPAGWERRHTPGSFTYAAHHAFFAGFLPTPADDPKRERLFAVEFPGNEDTGSDTWFTPGPTVVQGLADVGYRTLCVGGVGFFNPATPLGTVLPSLFQESFFDVSTGVTDPRSFDHQISHLARVLPGDDRPLFCFVDVPTVHQPNRHHLPDTDQSLPDDLASHAAALRAVDASLPRLLDVVAARRRPTLMLLTSDHGTTYGDDGLHGHRLAHEATWTVPYAEIWIP